MDPLAIQPPHSANRHDAGCGGAGDYRAVRELTAATADFFYVVRRVPDYLAGRSDTMFAETLRRNRYDPVYANTCNLYPILALICPYWRLSWRHLNLLWGRPVPHAVVALRSFETVLQNMVFVNRRRRQKSSTGRTLSMYQCRSRLQDTNTRNGTETRRLPITALSAGEDFIPTKVEHPTHKIPKIKIAGTRERAC